MSGPRTGGAGTLIRRSHGAATLLVYPSSPAAKAGLRSGDVLDLDPATPADRWMYGHAIGYGLAPFGHHVTYYVRRTHGVEAADVVIVRRNDSSSGFWRAFDAITALSVPWMLLSAAFVFWRASGRRALLLGLLLFCWGFGNQLWQAKFYTPWLSLDVAADIIDKALDALEIALIVFYGATFGVLGARRRAFGAVLIVAAAVNFLWRSALDVTIASAPVIYLHLPALDRLWPALLIACGLMLLATIPLAARERDVYIWSALPIAVVCVLQGVGTSMYALPTSPLRTAAYIAVEVGFLALPVGITYAIFARRVLEVGFVLNRAAVFSGVSIVIVGAFVLLEWVLSRSLENVSHAANVAIDGGVALALGMSTRFVHARVEHALDAVFFRKRYDDEKALLALAREAPYFDDTQVLVQRAIEALEKHADASSAHFVETIGDDPAIVAMRSTHERVDLTAISGTAISGEWAYPLVARGKLVGALVLGPKRSGESYAPDECVAIAHLAASVANALEGDVKRADDRLARIEALLERLLASASSNR